MYKITWSDMTLASESMEFVLAELRRIHESCLGQQSVLVTVEVGARADSLSIGLGRDRSVLSYVAGSGEPPYYLSLGKDLAANDFVSFSFGDSLSEYPLKNCVSLHEALDAMQVFCERGELTTALQWEEV
jgi:hypothetical protein